MAKKLNKKSNIHVFSLGLTEHHEFIDLEDFYTFIKEEWLPATNIDNGIDFSEESDALWVCMPGEEPRRVAMIKVDINFTLDFI